jgi:hypothetical protein
MNERLLVNAALVHLIEGTGDWKEEARTVIAYADKLPQSKRVTIRTQFNSHNSGESLNAHTPEHGNVELKTPDTTETKVKEWGIHKDRVGEFRFMESLEKHYCIPSLLEIRCNNPRCGRY